MTPGDLVQLLRPTQWVKNVVVFAGPAAGLRLFDAAHFWHAVIAFAAFCLAASATYSINDALDHKADAAHPTKRLRPVARGVIRPLTAIGLGVILILGALAATLAIPQRAVTLVVGMYFVLTLAYSLVLKRRMILDVITISTGFVLRAWAGSLAVGVVTSRWLVACMFTLCLFMGFGKRRCELAMLSDPDQAQRHRRTLIRYTPDLLSHLISVSAGIAVITFLLYTLDARGSSSPFAKEHLFFTLPIVVYGVFRYAMITELGVYSGPTEIVLKDKALLATIILWAVVAMGIAYQQRLFGRDVIAPLLGGG
jgi:4-hydroxybenzoate polyprenyltransferase